MEEEASLHFDGKLLLSIASARNYRTSLFFFYLVFKSSISQFAQCTGLATIALVEGMIQQQ